MKETTTKYLKFTPIKDTGKTQVFDVKSASNDSVLGRIGWYAPWRKYTFVPITFFVIFDKVCLQDIVSFLGSLMAERKTNG